MQTGLFSMTVTIEPFVSRDEFGEPGYGSAVTYPARVEARSRLIAGSAGQEIAARGRVFLLATETPSVDDLMTLPEGYTPRQPPILEAYPVKDQAGRTQYVVAYYG